MSPSLENLIDNYALIKDGVVTNIVIVPKEDVTTVVSETGCDEAIPLTEERLNGYFPRIGSHLDVNGDFFPPNWIQNDDGIFVPPLPKPNDGCVYEWSESEQEWVKLTPFPSWTWDPVTRETSAPVAYPENEPLGKFKWNDPNMTWILNPNWEEPTIIE